MYNAAVWLANVREVSGKDIDIDWQPFSLAQVNNDKGPDFKLWDRPEHLDGSDRTFLAHRAGLSAKRQGKDAFESFFMTLLKVRHEEKKDLTDPAVVEEAPRQTPTAKVEDQSVEKSSAPAVVEREPTAAKSPVASPGRSGDGPTPIQQLMKTKSFRDLVIAKLVRRLR